MRKAEKKAADEKAAAEAKMKAAAEEKAKAEAATKAAEKPAETFDFGDLGGDIGF